MSFRKFKTVGLLLVFTTGVFPVVALNCPGPAMQSCHPCCANENRPQITAALGAPSSAASCCAASSDEQSPRTESRVTSRTLNTARPMAAAASLALPFRQNAEIERNESVVPHAPAQSSLCTFLI